MGEQLLLSSAVMKGYLSVVGTVGEYAFFRRIGCCFCFGSGHRMHQDFHCPLPFLELLDPHDYGLIVQWRVQRDKSQLYMLLRWLLMWDAWNVD